MSVPKWWPLVWRSTLDTARFDLAAVEQMHERLAAEREANLQRTYQCNRELYTEIQRLNKQLAAQDAAALEALTIGNEEIIRLDSVVRERDRAIDAFVAQEKAAIAELSELRERLLAFTNPRSDSKRSKLTEAIRDQARQPDGVIDRRLLSYFRGEANRLMRDEKMSEADAIQAIGEWQSTEVQDRPTIDRIVASFHDKAGL